MEFWIDKSVRGPLQCFQIDMLKEFFQQIMAEISGGDFGLPERLPENMVVWIGYRAHADNITDIRRVWQLRRRWGFLKGLRGAVGATDGGPVSAGMLPQPDYILPFQGIAPKGLYISSG